MNQTDSMLDPVDRAETSCPDMVGWPLVARAQQPSKLPTIGFFGSATPATMGPWVAAFVRRLGELGWIENRTVSIEYRWAEGRSERYSEIATELVRLKVDVIVTGGTPTAAATKAVTAGIPIVFTLGADPVGSGLVASLARPGGNVTGLSLQSPETAGKRLALLREIVPNFHWVAFMGNVDNPIVPSEWREVEAAARTLGLEAVSLEIRGKQDILPTFAALKQRAEALYLANDGLVDANRHRINILALGARLPTTWSQRELVEVEASCPTDRTSATCSGAPPIMSIRFCAARNRRKFRSSSRPSSIS
jgi:ABC-type uncharacterized transport system substrate-binding protein